MNADYREMFKLTRYGAVRELRRLTEEGYLLMEGERRGARYVPVPLFGSLQRYERYELDMCAHNSQAETRMGAGAPEPRGR